MCDAPNVKLRKRGSLDSTAARGNFPLTMNPATFWPCLVLFGLAAGRVVGADVGAAERQHPVKAYLLVPARVFDSEDAKIREGWAVLVASNRITAAGPAAKIKA